MQRFRGQTLAIYSRNEFIDLEKIFVCRDLGNRLWLDKAEMNLLSLRKNLYMKISLTPTVVMCINRTSNSDYFFFSPISL